MSSKSFKCLNFIKNCPETCVTEVIPLASLMDWRDDIHNLSTDYRFNLSSIMNKAMKFSLKMVKR